MLQPLLEVEQIRLFIASGKAILLFCEGLRTKCAGGENYGKAVDRFFFDVCRIMYLQNNLQNGSIQ